MSLFLAAALGAAALAGAPPAWQAQLTGDGCTARQTAAFQGGTVVELQRLPGNNRLGIAVENAHWSKTAFRIGRPVRLTLEPGDSAADGSFGLYPQTSVPLLRFHTVEPGFVTQLRAAHAVKITGGKGAPASIPLVDPGKGLDALQACEAQILRSWGIDPEARAALRSPPIPVKPLASYASDADYPENVSVQGTTVAVLDVLPDGRIGGCGIVVSARMAALDERACAIFRRGRFTPAVDASGQPARAAFVEMLRWYPSR